MASIQSRVHLNNLSKLLSISPLPSKQIWNLVKVIMTAYFPECPSRKYLMKERAKALLHRYHLWWKLNITQKAEEVGLSVVWSKNCLHTLKSKACSRVLGSKRWAFHPMHIILWLGLEATALITLFTRQIHWQERSDNE